MLLNTATGKYWGPKPALMLWAYKHVVLPSLCYGCVVFAHTLDETRLAKLRRLNRLALQLITPIARRTPTGGLEVITDTPPIHLEMQRRSLNTILRIERPKPIWNGIMSNGSPGFYKHWSAQIPDTLSKAPLNRCRTLFNWVLGLSATLRPPTLKASADKVNAAPKRVEKHWRLSVASKEWEGSIGIAYTIANPAGTIRKEASRRYRNEVRKDPILAHEITNALTDLLENEHTLNVGDAVIVCSDLTRTILASPLVKSSALANLIVKTRQTRLRTGCPVHFTTKPSTQEKEKTALLLENTSNADIYPSPFHDPTFAKRELLSLRNLKWQEEWSNWGNYWSSTKNCSQPYAAQTKLWIPTVDSNRELTKFGCPTLGELIQFITGHGWFRRHRSKIDNVPSTCRFCNSAAEDPAHIWSKCSSFEQTRLAIRQECEKETDVSFTIPFVYIFI